MKKVKITVLGSFVIDLTSRAPHLPVTGETVKGSSFKMGPGGKGSNQGVAAQRTGADVTMITKVGKDTFGEIAMNNFINEGMDTRFIFQDEHHETGTALIMVDEHTSDNKILVTLGACNHISQSDVQKAAEHIKTSGLFLTQLETNMEAIEEGIDIAHKAGVPVVLNPAPIQAVSDCLLKKVDIITPNEIEAEMLTGIKIDTYESMQKAAQYFMDRGVSKVIITLGSKGVFVKSDTIEKRVPSIAVKAVDTAGAGDAFNGGFVTALCEGKDLLEAVIFGNAVGALSVTKVGTAPAMPTRDEVEALLRKQENIE